MDNIEFQGIINRALDRMQFDDGAEVVAKRFAAQTGYLETNWGKFKNGEGYIQTGVKGRPDLQRKARNIISKIQTRIDDIDSDFTERYGWTRNASLNTEYKQVNPEATPPQLEGVDDGN